MLPKILKPFHSDKSNLVRIGPKKDGGYVIDKRVIEKSEVIITCGLNDKKSKRNYPIEGLDFKNHKKGPEIELKFNE